MKIIQLSKGQFTEVDDDDYDYLARWSWYALKTKTAFYAAGSESYPDGTMSHFLMHRIILRAEPGQFVDHRDGNTLNNCKSNLRRCTPQQNTMNMKLPKTNTTGFKGVGVTPIGKWRSNIQINGKTRFLGHFDTALEAARRYDQEAILIFGEFAKTNEALGLISADLRKQMAQEAMATGPETEKTE